MDFKLTFCADEAYYKEGYREIISSFKLKKYEPLFAGISIVAGIGLYVYDRHHILGLFPFVFSISGIYTFYKTYYEKKKWLKDRMTSKIANEMLEIAFSDIEIKHLGPFSKGEMRWDGLKDILETKNGILIKPENGLSIYLSKKQFANREQIEFVLSKKIKN